MTLHLLRFASGHDSVTALRCHQAKEMARLTAEGRPGIVPHYIRNRRRRSAEFTADSSLYWIINGAYACRQGILGFEDGIDPDGRGFTVMLLDPELVPVETRPRKNFGGWRYLDETQVPPDRASGTSERHDDGDGLPEDMRRDLERLGLL